MKNTLECINVCIDASISEREQPNNGIHIYSGTVLILVYHHNMSKCNGMYSFSFGIHFRALSFSFERRLLEKR